MPGRTIRGVIFSILSRSPRRRRAFAGEQAQDLGEPRLLRRVAAGGGADRFGDVVGGAFDDALGGHAVVAQALLVGEAQGEQHQGLVLAQALGLARRGGRRPAGTRRHTIWSRCDTSKR